MSHSNPIQPPTLPSGWFYVGTANQLTPGQIQSCQVGGQDLVLYRTHSGKVCVSDAHCPHMGAHLGKGGKIQGEDIWCPFHGFCFNPEGACTQTVYGRKPPPKAKLHQWPVQECHGRLFVYYDPDQQTPSWELPTMSEDGWTSFREYSWTFEAHPQDVAENGVDLGHFLVVHHYELLDTFVDFEADGPRMHTHYLLGRSGDFIGKPHKTIELDVDIWIHGLGCSIVHVNVPEVGLQTRQFIMVTPHDEKQVSFHGHLAIRKGGLSGQLPMWLQWVPTALVDSVGLFFVGRGFAHDVEQDIPIWKHKKHFTQPALADGDGPIIKYRRWAKQFQK